MSAESSRIDTMSQLTSNLDFMRLFLTAMRSFIFKIQLEVSYDTKVSIVVCFSHPVPAAFAFRSVIPVEARHISASRSIEISGYVIRVFSFYSLRSYLQGGSDARQRCA